MTIAIHPGCFGSALFYRAGAPECSTCAVASMCATSALERVTVVEAILARLDSSFSLDRSTSVKRWIKGRWKRDTAKDRKRKSAQATLDAWKKLDLNPYELRHRMNPAPAKTVLHTVFKLIIESAEGFTRKDILDELYSVRLQTNPAFTKAASKSATDTVCDALVEAGVLKVESRGVLCLTR